MNEPVIPERKSRKGLQRQVKEDVVAFADEVVSRMRLELDAMETRVNAAEAKVAEQEATIKRVDRDHTSLPDDAYHVYSGMGHVLRYLSPCRRSADPAGAPAMMTETGTRFHASLTPKERLICPLVATGLPNKLIAWELGTNEQVVKNYLRFMYQKAGMESRVEFLMFLFRHGVVECPCRRGKEGADE